VIIGESLSTQTLILTVLKDNIDTCPLPDRFVTSLVYRNFLLIALMVNYFAIFLQPLSIL